MRTRTLELSKSAHNGALFYKRARTLEKHAAELETLIIETQNAHEQTGQRAFCHVYLHRSTLLLPSASSQITVSHAMGRERLPR